MSSSPRRGKPEFWVTSLNDLLAGEASCRFRAWFLGRHWVRNDDPNFDKAGWIADHAAMVLRRKAELEAEGWTVWIEDQNAFTLFGKSGSRLSGKPDIVAVRAPDIGEGLDAWLVEDCKTGKRYMKDYWQVIEYLLAIPRVRPDVPRAQLRGRLTYKDGSVGIEPPECSPERQAQIFALLQELSFGIPPEPIPSERECGQCKLSLAECARKAGTARFTATSDDF